MSRIYKSYFSFPRTEYEAKSTDNSYFGWRKLIESMKEWCSSKLNKNFYTFEFADNDVEVKIKFVNSEDYMMFRLSFDV